MSATVHALSCWILGLCAAIFLRLPRQAARRAKVRNSVCLHHEMRPERDKSLPIGAIARAASSRYYLCSQVDLRDCNVVLANPYRKAVLLTGLLLGVPSMSIAADIPGVIKLPSRHSVAATIDRLEEILKQRAIVVFARIDFSGDAGRAGLSMRPEQMLIFGNPKAGTPLMVAVPAIGLDLPMKVLVWEDADGKVWAAYKDPKYLVRHYGVSADLAANLAAVVPIIERAVAGE